MKKTVLYIIGAGSAGSTLFSMIMGAHSKITCVGELSRFDQYKALDMKCACGEPVSSCEFWSKIDTKKSKGYPAPIRPMNRLISLFLHKNNLLKKDPNSLKTIERNLSVYNDIFEAAKTEMVIDSSKDLLRLMYLFLTGHIKIVPIYMIRDVRAYMTSMQKSNYPALLSYFRWIARNLLVMKVIKIMRAKSSVITIEYEQLTKHPDEVLKKTCKQLGISYQKKMLHYYQNTHHNIAGTDIRFAPKPIEANEKWRTQLSKSGQFIYKYLGGRYFNTKFGIVQN